MTCMYFIAIFIMKAVLDSSPWLQQGDSGGTWADGEGQGRRLQALTPATHTPSNVYTPNYIPCAKQTWWNWDYTI